MSEHDDLLSVFHEEAEDLLAELEATLLALESGEFDDEHIVAAFRQLHTLKGTCAMYGFATTAALAHEVETLFARVREGSVSLSPELVDLALRARDSMASLVFDSSDDTAAARETTQLLIDTMQEFEVRDSDTSAPGSASDEADASAGQPAIEYIVDLHPRGDVFLRGVNLGGIVAELSALGPATVDVDTSHVPPLADLDPEQCYLSVTVRVATSCGREAVENALMFLDGGEYSIEAGHESVAGGLRASEGVVRARTNRTQSVRVAAERLDELVNLVGELVTTQVTLRDALSDVESERARDANEHLERLVQSLRESVLGMRMIPIGTTFGRFARYVRDLSRELGKDAEIVTSGGTSELDRGVIERIEEPLLHLIRNSIDHGIESPVRRRAAGKRERGTIELSAYHSGGSMYIRLKDDGRGVDLAAVAERARSNDRLADALPELSEQDLLDMVFGAGFSTAAEVTSVSGRGVGLDAVRRAVEGLQGSVDFESRPSEGVTVTIRLPLTLAIIDGLLVKVGEESYVLPLSGIEECLDFEQPQDWSDHGRALMRVRDEVLPIVRLREFFDVAGEPPHEETTAVANVDGERFGIVVDGVADRLQVVIKPLGRGLKRAEGLAGATMLGDGSVAFVVDMGQIRRLAGIRKRADGAPIELGRDA